MLTSPLASRDAGDVEGQVPRGRTLRWDVTRHDYRRVIAVQTVYLFVSFAGLSVVSIAIFSALRVLVLALFLIGSERESNFSDLEAGEEAALGLVMDAHGLREALSAALAGRPWKGHIRQHRGTVLRMQHTLAISYKWHTTERALGCEGGSLNMSDFQIQAVIKGIKATRCDYV
jgi:hypothetical protein